MLKSEQTVQESSKLFGFFISPSVQEQQSPNVSIFEREDGLTHETMYGPRKQNEGNVVYVSLDDLLPDNITFSVEK